MNILIWIFVAAIIFAALIALIGMTKPRIVHVSRSATMNATPTAVYTQVTDLKKFAKWSPWADKDPDMEQSFNGKTELGAEMEWNGNKQVGAGKMTIVEADKPNSVNLALEFVGMGTATAYWTIAKKGKGTEATWSVDADMGNNPMARLMGKKIGQMIGDDYEKGLANLKAIVEK